MKFYKFVSLNATKKDDAWVISGNDTFALKETIKSMGGKWDPTTKAWSVIADDLTTLSEAAKTLGESRAAEKKAAKEYALSPEGINARIEAEKARIAACLAEKARTGAYHWICCDKCTVIDWIRQHTSCDACAVDCGLYKNTFRVRGRIYTGD